MRRVPGWGINIEGKVAYSRYFTFQAGYTYQQSQYTEAQAWSSSVAPQKRMLHTPDNYAYMLLDINPVKDFTISFNGKVTGSMLVPHLAGFIENDEEVKTPSSGIWASVWHTMYTSINTTVWRSVAA